MCIVAIAWQLFDDMPLMLLSNRDEFLNRPTLHAHQWEDLSIFAGRDQLDGGTWLGHSHNTSLKRSIKESANNRWATVLNFREIPNQQDYNFSRGKLVTDFLTSNLSPMAFAKEIILTDYAGFNLIVGSGTQAVLVNNRGYPPTALHSGLHVLSNGQPNDTWFKCERLRMRVSQEILPLLLTNNERGWQSFAFEVLTDNLPADIHELPNTGLPIELEQALSSVFIPLRSKKSLTSLKKIQSIKSYATRTQSILTLRNQKFKLLEKEVHRV